MSFAYARTLQSKAIFFFSQYFVWPTTIIICVSIHVTRTQSDALPSLQLQHDWLPRSLSCFCHLQSNRTMQNEAKKKNADFNAGMTKSMSQWIWVFWPFSHRQFYLRQIAYLLPLFCCQFSFFSSPNTSKFTTLTRDGRRNVRRKWTRETSVDKPWVSVLRLINNYICLSHISS